MTAETRRAGASRQASNAARRQSRRPSRLGSPAGAAATPDYPLDDDAGFPGFLKRVWRRAKQTPDLTRAVEILLTLDGHVPADVQLRALGGAEEIALGVLTGVAWRAAHPYAASAPHGTRPAGEPAFLGEIGLGISGRVLVRTPSRGPLAASAGLVDGVIRVPWSVRELHDYQIALSAARRRSAQSIADCRNWLAKAGARGRDALLEQLKEAAQRTAPFVLYYEDRQYTNFRDRNTLTGKTLWPGHPDCALSGLHRLPLELWSDDDLTMVVTLTLLIRSGGFGRIEEANGTQLTLDHVAHLLEQVRRRYNEVAAGPDTGPDTGTNTGPDSAAGAPIPPAAGAGVESLSRLADALRERRGRFGPGVRLYREIHGVLMHKIERVAGPAGPPARRRESALCVRLRRRLPLSGATLPELGAGLAAAPGWLAEPYAGFGTGLEALVYETVAAATDAFAADFAMSRGTRSLPTLIEALRRRQWQEITEWDITAFFCCVVPAVRAPRLFGNSVAHLADTSWAISSRMQYNSWHFIAGNLPKVPAVEARDYFVPPTMPDLALYSDQHHRGHVASKVRFSIRSPQPVQVLDRTFTGFVDLRLLRCEGTPFDEQDLLAAHRVSAFIARATTLAAGLAAAGAELEVTSFDSRWHWTSLAERCPR